MSGLLKFCWRGLPSLQGSSLNTVGASVGLSGNTVIFAYPASQEGTRFPSGLFVQGYELTLPIDTPASIVLSFGFAGQTASAAALVAYS